MSVEVMMTRRTRAINYLLRDSAAASRLNFVHVKWPVSWLLNKLTMQRSVASLLDALFLPRDDTLARHVTENGPICYTKLKQNFNGHYIHLWVFQWTWIFINVIFVVWHNIGAKSKTSCKARRGLYATMMVNSDNNVDKKKSTEKRANVLIAHCGYGWSTHWSKWVTPKRGRQIHVE